MKQDKSKKDKTLKKYKCGWCGNEFEQYVASSSCIGNHGVISDQVQCKICKMFLPTWGK